MVLARWALPRWALALRGSRSKARWKSASAAIGSWPSREKPLATSRFASAGQVRIASPNAFSASSRRSSRDKASACAASTAGDFSPSSMPCPRSDRASLGMTQLQVRQAAIDPGVDELAIDLEGTIVGRQRLDEPAGSREGQAAIQVWPGEIRRQDRADREIRDGVRVSALIAMADPQGEPGPEHARFTAGGLAQEELGAVGLPHDQVRGPREIEVLGSAWLHLRGEFEVARRGLILAQQRQDPPTILVEGCRRMRLEEAGDFEPVDSPSIGLRERLPGLGLLGDPDLGANLEEDQLGELAAERGRFSSRQITELGGDATVLAIAREVGTHRAPGQVDSPDEVAVRAAVIGIEQQLALLEIVAKCEVRQMGTARSSRPPMRTRASAPAMTRASRARVAIVVMLERAGCRRRHLTARSEREGSGVCLSGQFVR